MKKILLAAITSGLFLFSVPVLAQYLIQFTHESSVQSPKGQAADYLAQLVNKRLKGKVKMVVYPDSQLYGDVKALELMAFNSGQTGLMAAPNLLSFSKLSRSLQVFELPFLFKDMRDVHRLLDSDVVTEMTTPLQRKGIKVVSFWDNGMKVFSSQGDLPLLIPDIDFSGKRLAVRDSAIQREVVKAMGAEFEVLAGKNVRSALETGRVDGQDSTWATLLENNLYEIQDYVVVSNHAYSGAMVVISSDFWDTLPDPVKRVLTQSVGDATVYERERAMKAELDAKKIALQHNKQLTVVELEGENRAAWKRAMGKIEAQFSRRIGQGLLDAVHEQLMH